MEESAQRRERLKAMRMEALQGDTTCNNDHSAVSLSNPFLESMTNSESQVQTTSQGFNYYTNPMAAYSGNKQRSQISPQISQDYSSTPQRTRTNETFPSPSLQPYLNHSPSPQMQQSQGHFVYSSNPPQSSNLPRPSWDRNCPHPRGYCDPGGVGFPSPQTHFTSSSGQGGYPSPGPSPPFTNSPGQGSGRGHPSPGPNFRNSPNHGLGPGPHFTNSPGHGPGRGYPSPGPNFRNSPNHDPGQGGYPRPGPNQGRGYGFGYATPGPSSGRGRGRGLGQGGGRGRGHNHISAEDQPDRFFNKSMVEDPWKFLEPVIWKSLKKQWFPHSVNAKKPRVSESPRQSSSQPSLAEILASSFNEAADDEPSAG